MEHVMSPEKSSPQTTLVILLGASKWPLSSLASSSAFKGSANKVKDYFCSPHLFGLPPQNWLDLFDTNQGSPNEVDQAISSFLDRRIRRLEQAGAPARDLIFYYIGYGLFASDSEQAYHLAILSTRDGNIGASAVAMASLASTLKTKARYLRRIVILDCCFAATSFKYMQSAPDQAAIAQTKSAFEEYGKESGFPQRGTALFCSSGHTTPSLILEDESGTMFSEAFIRALSQGDTYQLENPYFSLYNLKQLTIDHLKLLAGEHAPRPEVHSPDQSNGDVAAVPFFPNLHIKGRSYHQAEDIREEAIKKRLPQLQTELFPTQQTNVLLGKNFAPSSNTISASGMLLLTYKHTGGQIRKIDWSPNGKYLAVGGTDGAIHIWEIMAGKLFLILQGHSNAVTAVAWSPDGQLLASSSADKTVLLWDITSGRQRYCYKGHSERVWAVAWSPDGQLLASSSADKTVHIWDAVYGRREDCYKGHSKMVLDVAWSPDGRLLASGSLDETIQVWDAAANKRGLPAILRRHHNLKGHSSGVAAIAWSPNGQLLASGSGDKTVQVWDARSGRLVHRYEGHSKMVLDVAWSPDGQLLASSGVDKTAQVWDTTSGRLVHRCEGHASAVNTVAWSPDGRLFASGSEEVQVWDAISGKQISRHEDHISSVVTAVAWSPNGQLLASGSEDKTVQVWDAISGKQRSCFRGHADVVNALVWSPDGHLLASGSNDRTVQVWNASSGNVLFTYNGHFTSVHSVTWSPDGKQIASAAHEVHVWQAL